jgi:hypothetical protein
MLGVVIKLISSDYAAMGIVRILFTIYVRLLQQKSLIFTTLRLPNRYQELLFSDPRDQMSKWHREREVAKKPLKLYDRAVLASVCPRKALGAVEATVGPREPRAAAVAIVALQESQEAVHPAIVVLLANHAEDLAIGFHLELLAEDCGLVNAALIKAPEGECAQEILVTKVDCHQRRLRAG